jgi:Mrp family chromosome partitioning ATPase
MPVGNILKRILLKLGISQNQGVILCIVAGVIATILFVLILIILRRRKFKKVINVNLTENKEGGDKRPEDNYEPIIKRIKQVKKKYKSILFTSIEAGALPVTIPVNVAIGLTKNKKRCLLIDLDLRRDAIAKVFGLDAERGGLRAKAVQTEIENLWVWPGHNFSQLKQMNVAEIVERALDKKSLDKFDFVLINAPSVVSSPDRKQIISAARAAFICTKNTSSEMKRLTELMKPLDCTIIGRIRVP